MFYRKYYHKLKISKASKNDGFSLIETATALTTLGICTAYAMPLFLYAKLNNAKTESRSGALMISQKIFDKVRSRKVTEIATDLNRCKLDAGVPNISDPTSDSNIVDKIVLTTPTFTSSSVANSTTDCTTSAANFLKETIAANNMKYEALGKKYATRVIFCETTGDCDANSRKFKVEVFGQDGSKVYELSGTYANFE
jgi:Tfp pilus assembly protein PilV